MSTTTEILVALAAVIGYTMIGHVVYRVFERRGYTSRWLLDNESCAALWLPLAVLWLNHKILRTVLIDWPHKLILSVERRLFSERSEPNR